MANTTLLFHGSETTGTEKSTLSLYANANNEITIIIDEIDFSKRFICLDKKTAIKLHRELKKQISFLDESEVKNV